MPRVPDRFDAEFDDKGDSFFDLAELLYLNPDRQYTQDELADRIERSNTTVSNHLGEMADSGWLTRQENQTTFAWNTETHDPASTEALTAIKRFYADFWKLLRKHGGTAPGGFVIAGFALLLAAIVIFAFYVGFSLGITQESPIPNVIFLTIAVGAFLTGVIVTFLSPIQAVANRIIWRYTPENLFRKD